MAIKKSDLYSKLWKSCDELRGGMDASQYKDYILVLLFMRYVTDKYYGKEDALIEIPEGGSFKDLSKLKGDKEIGDKINKVIRKMANENDLVGVITVADFNDSDKLGKGKEMVDRLSNLIAIFEDEELNFSGNSAEDDDILGDAYEYLMRNFATQSGKSKGQFYTPAEVSRVIAKVIGINQAKSTDQTIYDPTCGSGSLLLKAADEAPVKVTIYGQEKDVSTVALAKMNMILHSNEYADIEQGDTITSPEFKDPSTGKLKTFDFAVANPPFSTKSWSNGLDINNDPYKRFTGIGIPPTKNGDYAFFLHLVKSLKGKTGKGAIILPHGVLFRGNAEAEIRTNIIKRGYIKGIIGLPANLFYGTGIPACIIVIDKENAEARKGIFMIDASKGFMKDGNKNRLREQDIRKIVDVFNNQIKIPKYSRMVFVDEIEKNEYNLNISRYIDIQEEEDIQDITAHLKGGIPERDIDKLQKYWDVCPSIKNELFKGNGNDGYSKLAVSIDEIKTTIYENAEFKKFTDEVEKILDGWKQRTIPLLKSIESGTKPRILIYEISEDILKIFENNKLIDKYNIYQYLLTYWLEIMKDDIYMIIENGWVANNDLISEELIINRYFKAEKEAIGQLETDKDEVTRKKEEFEEWNSGEDGVLEDLKNDKKKISKDEIQKRIKEIKSDKESSDELKILKEYVTLIDKESKANKKIKCAQKELNDKVKKKYKELTTDEVKTMIVDDKWMTSIIFEINGEIEKILHKLISRIKELAERYEKTLPQIENEVEEYEAKVRAHLERMGFVW